MLQKLQTAYLSAVLKFPWLVVLAIAVLTIGLASQLDQLKIDASSDALTLEYDKDLDYFREISKRYQAGDFLVVTYTPKQDLFADATLESLANLRADLLKVDGVASANSILDVPLLYSPKVSLSDVTSSVKTLRDEGVDRELAKQEFSHSPIYKGMLLGPDGKTTAILLNLAIDEKFIRLVRERDALRLQRSTQGLSSAESRRLEKVTQDFLVYSTAATEKSHQRVQEVRKVVENYKADAQIFLGGVSMITADMVRFIRSDIMVFGIGILVFIIVILSIIFRQWQFVVLPLTICSLAVVIMLGFLAAIDWRLTVISANFVALLLIICLMITIHLIVRYREECQLHPKEDRVFWLRATIKHMVKPCVYTVLTTMVAFVSLVASGIRPVMDFGWMMAIGLMVAFVLAFLLIPAGLMLLPNTAIKKKAEAENKVQQNESDNSGAFTLIFSRFTERHGMLIVVLGCLATIVSLVGIKQLEVENRFIDYFHSSTEIHQGMLVIDQQLGGTITLDVILDHPIAEKKSTAGVPDPFGESEDPFGTNVDDPFAFDTSSPLSPPPSSEFGSFELGSVDPFSSDPFANSVNESKPASSGNTDGSYWFTYAGLEKITRFHDYLDSLPEIGKVQSLAVAYKVANDLNGRQVNDFELALMRNLLPEDIKDLLLKPYLASDINQTRITMRVKETDPDLRRNELVREVRRYAVEEMGFADENVHVTGVLVLYNNMLQSLFSSQILTIGAVFFGILIMFIVLFRSISLSLIALVPNMLAAIVVLGGMGLLGIPLDMMTITIAAIAVGIGVDDAIHYIYRYREEFAVDRNYLATMHRAHASIGRAMYYTSVTVIVGFSILALSKFIPSIYFGLLTGLAMLAAIISSLTLLPQLMILIKPFGAELVGDEGVK
ncbi:MAG: putative RND superfamily exporter protein [Candidatus Endobugula sp.]|jgi:predicted RND superfamily exporter protein